MNKGTVSENNIDIYYKEHKQILTELDNAYRCVKTSTITDDYKSEDNIERAHQGVCD